MPDLRCINIVIPATYSYQKNLDRKLYVNVIESQQYFNITSKTSHLKFLRFLFDITKGRSSDMK
jgi:hypothetical protein